MHPQFRKPDKWTRNLICAATEVRRGNGPARIKCVHDKGPMHGLLLRHMVETRKGDW